MAPLFQAREIPRIVPSLPPVKRLAADTEVATGQRRILSMPPVMVQPLQSCFCQLADPLDPAYDFGTRSSRTYCLHDDTILSVTHHYDREQGRPPSNLARAVVDGGAAPSYTPLAGPTVMLRGGGRVIKEGDRAPDFSTIDHTSKQVRLSNLKGSKVWLWFYSSPGGGN